MSVCYELGQVRNQETNLDPVHYTPMTKPVVICPNRHIFDRATHQEIIDIAAPCPLCRDVVFPIPRQAPWRKRVAFKIADAITGHKEIAVLSAVIIGGCTAIAYRTTPLIKVIVEKAYQPSYIKSFFYSPTPETFYYDTAERVATTALMAIIATGVCVAVTTIAKTAWNYGKN